MEIINKFNIEEIKTEFAELTKSLKIIGKNKKNYKQKLIDRLKGHKNLSSIAI